MNETTAPGFDDGVSLMAQIAAANAADLAHTTNALLDNYQRQVKELQFRLDRVMEIVDDAEVIDRTTRNRLFSALHGSLPADLFGAVSS